MQRYFISEDTFPEFAQTVSDTIAAGKGSVVQYTGGPAVLSRVIQAELAAFQHNSGALQLIQRAMIIDWNNMVPCDYILEECAAAIQISSPSWNVFPIKKELGDGVTSIYNSLLKRTLFQAARQCSGIASRARLRMICRTVFFVSFCLSLCAFYGAGSGIASVISVGWSAGIAITVSWIVGILLQEASLARLDVSQLKDAIGKKRGTPEGNLFVSNIGKVITHKMPVAIIVEDSANLDVITAEIMDHILSSGTISCIGAILWIVFQNRSGTGGHSLIQKHGIPSKHFSLCQGILFGQT